MPSFFIFGHRASGNITIRLTARKERGRVPFFTTKNTTFNSCAFKNNFERVTGIEPVSHPWQGRIIATIRYPPSLRFGGQARDCVTQTSIFNFLVPSPRIELGTQGFSVRRLSRISSRAESQDRTGDTRIFSPLLYH
jgi:hypothetical protein